MGFRILLVSTKVPEYHLGVVFLSYLNNDPKPVDLFRHNSSRTDGIQQNEIIRIFKRNNYVGKYSVVKHAW